MTETRWQRFWKWLRKQPPIKRQINGLRRTAILLACGAICLIFLALFAAFNLALTYKSSEPLSVLPDLGWFSAISFLVLFLYMVGAVVVFSMFLFIIALYFYCQSLSLRIKELEKKLEAHGMREVKSQDAKQKIHEIFEKYENYENYDPQDLKKEVLAVLDSDKK